MSNILLAAWYFLTSVCKFFGLWLQCLRQLGSLAQTCPLCTTTPVSGTNHLDKWHKVTHHTMRWKTVHYSCYNKLYVMYLYPWSPVCAHSQEPVHRMDTFNRRGNSWGCQSVWPLAQHVTPCKFHDDRVWKFSGSDVGAAAAAAALAHTAWGGLSTSRTILSCLVAEPTVEQYICIQLPASRTIWDSY